MPQVIVKLWPGTSEQQNVRLAQTIRKNARVAKVYQTDIVGNAATLYKKPEYPM